VQLLTRLIIHCKYAMKVPGPWTRLTGL